MESLTVKEVYVLPEPVLSESKGRARRPHAPQESAPVLVSFDGVPAREVLALSDAGAEKGSEDARVSCYFDRTRACVEAVAETRRVEYRGSAGDVVQLPRKTVLGVVDRKRGTVRLVESWGIVPLVKRFKGSGGSSDAALDESLDFAARRSRLAEEFGTRKKMVQMRGSAVNQLPHSDAALDVTKEQREAAQTAADKAVVEASRTDADAAADLGQADLPPFHAGAVDKADVFSMEEIFPASLWNSSYEAAQTLAASAASGGFGAYQLRTEFEKITGPCESFISSVLNATAGCDRETMSERLTVLFCLTGLLCLVRLRPGDFATSQGFVRACQQKGHLSREDAFALGDTYLQREAHPDGKFAYVRSPVSAALIVNSFLAAALHLRGWVLSDSDCAAIAKDMRVFKDRIWNHLVRIGCEKKEKGSYELVASQEHPYSPHVESVRQRKPRKKAW